MYLEVYKPISILYKIWYSYIVILRRGQRVLFFVRQSVPLVILEKLGQLAFLSKRRRKHILLWRITTVCCTKICKKETKLARFSAFIYYLRCVIFLGYIRSVGIRAVTCVIKSSVVGTLHRLDGKFLLRGMVWWLVLLGISFWEIPGQALSYYEGIMVG